MFELENSIADWRRQMLAAGITTPMPLEELESHLREEIEQQVKLGASAQTAFQIAVERVGSGNLLKAEFKKVGAMNQAQKRKAAGYFILVLFSFYTLIMIPAMSKNDLPINEWCLGLAAQATLFLSVYCVWQLAPRFAPLIAGRRVQSAASLLGGISGAIWLITFVNLILPRFNFTTDQLMVALMWAMVPMLVLPCIAFLILDKNDSGPAQAAGL